MAKHRTHGIDAPKAVSCAPVRPAELALWPASRAPPDLIGSGARPTVGSSQFASKATWI